MGNGGPNTTTMRAGGDHRLSHRRASYRPEGWRAIRVARNAAAHIAASRIAAENIAASRIGAVRTVAGRIAAARIAVGRTVAGRIAAARIAVGRNVVERIAAFQTVAADRSRRPQTTALQKRRSSEATWGIILNLLPKAI